MSQEKQTLMQKMAAFIVHKRKPILMMYLLVFVFCIFAMGWVNVENDVTKYLPEDTETRQGIDVMNANFEPAATARIMVSNVTYETANQLNADIGAVEGVEMSEFDNTSDHYKDAAALFDVSLSGGNNEPETIQAMEKIRQILDPYDASIDTLVGYDENAMLMNEMMVITVVAVIIVLVVLTLTSRAYAEVPVLILTFGAAALLNMGTNFIFGTISFISNSIAVVLQLALAVDYAIILCHRFSDENETKPAIEAAIAALSKAIPEIGASSLTTIGGLGALAFMKFSIGADMAMVLVKSIFLSLLTVFTLMPGLLVFFSPLINKTKHRKLLPKITLVGRFAVKVRNILPPLFVLVLIGAFYLSSQCPYCYSYNDLKTAKMAERQHAYFKIKDTFGTSNMAAVIVPAGNYEAEGKILEELAACEQVESTMGLAGIEAMEGYMLTDALTPRQLAELIGLDNEITELLYSAYAMENDQYGQLINGIADYKVPLFDMFIFLKDTMETNHIELEGMENMTGMLAQLDTARAQMRSEDYSRMVVYLNVPEEGPETYDFLQEMRSIIGQYYEDDYYIVGNSTSSRDLSASFETDNLIITVLSILFVALILLGTFKSVGLAALLVLVIQGSIWINFSFPTLTETPLYFLGYLIVSAVQMGANIDYAIVISSHFEEHKKNMSYKEAIVKALNEAFPTIFTSGTMLASAGMLIGNMTEQPVVSIMGMCIGRGTIISMVLVILVLPSVLVFGNKLIEKSRFKLKLLSVLLCLTMVLALPSGVQAEEVDEKTEEQVETIVTKTIYIETAEEFLSFAEQCRLDTYSIGLQVELEENIDLTGMTFEAIPSFSGVFNGNDHVIRGLNLKTEGSVQGLFRYVRAGAVVKNLKLEGSIAPTGSRSSVGSLAGENAGIINNCSFSGSVSGNDRVGGLVGYNTLTGVIEACTVNGQIQGHHFVGGLAGENYGVIRKCSNEAAINTAVQDNEVGIGDISLESVLESESAVTVTDVGGIAGTNMGVIRECENLGNIGYAKIGYNMGGIAGSQSGYIVECVNRAQIQGRKEVGGIVGQMEPTLRMEFDEDTLQKLQVEMDTMMGLTGQTMASAQGSIAGVSGQISALEGYVKDAQSALEQISPEVKLPEDPAFGNGTVDVPQVNVPDLDTVLAAQNNLSSSLGQIPGTMDDMVASAKGTLGAISSSMQALGNQLGVIGNTVKNADEDMGGSIVDASDADTVEETGGKVQTCQNFGEVSGDLNVGGIVGAMSFESSLDPELDVTIVGDLSMNFEGEVRAVVLECYNYAAITADKQNGGGIAGRMGLGLVRGCENRGALQGGSYLGGITGRGDGGYIRENNTRCTIDGSEYVGGVAGTAVTVSDCYSITKFSGGAEKTGGVLGSIEEITEEIRSNYYLPIEEDIGGIDGISYEGGAQAMSAEQFFALKQLPEEFKTVMVRFVQENGSEEVVSLDYGEALKADKIPAVPEKDGASGRWEGIEDLDLSALYFDVTLRATYDAYEKVIAAEALRADGRPILLAGSEFGKDAFLQIEELVSGPVSVGDGEKTLEGWHFTMISMGETAKLRYLPPEEYDAEELANYEARIMVKDAAGTWRDVTYTVEGSYLIFEVDQQDESFCLVHEEENSWLLYVLIGIGAIIVIEAAVFGVIWLRRRKKTENILKVENREE